MQKDDERHVEWDRLLSEGHGPLQRQILDLDARTRLFRVFEPTIVPGTLQTAEYARAVLTGSMILHDVPDDVEAAVQARMKRQELLYQKDKSFHFVLAESALWIRRGSPSVMRAQLDRLNELSALPNVQLGIISSTTQYAMAVQHGFWLRDNEKVAVETYSAALHIDEPAEVAVYRKAFEHFASIAVHGNEARAIIAHVAEALVGRAR